LSCLHRTADAGFLTSERRAATRAFSRCSSLCAGARARLALTFSADRFTPG
jgi:hypothetical protein